MKKTGILIIVVALLVGACTTTAAPAAAVMAPAEPTEVVQPQVQAETICPNTSGDFIRLSLKLEAIPNGIAWESAFLCSGPATSVGTNLDQFLSGIKFEVSGANGSDPKEIVPSWEGGKASGELKNVDLPLLVNQYVLNGAGAKYMSAQVEENVFVFQIPTR